MKRRTVWLLDLLVLGCGGFLFGCVSGPIFPLEVLKKVDRTVRFEQVEKDPAKYKDRIVEFGGQIVGSMVEVEEVHLLVRELPIQVKPVYGPADHGEKRGLFIIRYKGTIGEQDLQHGNMVIVIGAVMGAVVSNVTSASISRPTVNAECFHVWRTQGDQINEFPYGQNFTLLVQQTYCVNRRDTILTTT